MSILKSALVKAAGNRIAQNLLEKNIQISQYLMGIGSGVSVSASGERSVFRFMKQKVNPPYCIFDVGSNKGQFLRLALDNINTPDFRIHCFEPGRETFSLLSSSAPSDERITLNNLAVGKEKGEAVLHYDAAGSGLASLTKRKLGHFGIDFSQEERVAVTTIDTYCAENNIDHIHLLKVDIEGHELDALSGAMRMFSANAIDIITFEFGGCNIDTRTYFQDFWYFFSELGFNIFRITPSGYLHPVTGYGEIHEQFRTVNFLAAK